MLKNAILHTVETKNMETQNTQVMFLIKQLGFQYKNTLTVNRLWPEKVTYHVIYYDRGLSYSTLTNQWTLGSDNLNVTLKL